MQILSPPIVTRCHCNKLRYSLNSFICLGAANRPILPVILEEILGSENVKKQGNLLLDSGAQVSLIKLSVADKLGLTGKKVTITTERKELKIIEDSCQKIGRQ